MEFKEESSSHEFVIEIVGAVALVGSLITAMVAIFCF
jgi:hypothetical protein